MTDLYELYCTDREAALEQIEGMSRDELALEARNMILADPLPFNECVGDFSPVTDAFVYRQFLQEYGGLLERKREGKNIPDEKLAEVLARYRRAEQRRSPAGVLLTPSFHGQRCQGNGKYPDVKCQCDGCKYDAVCYQDTLPAQEWIRKKAQLPDDWNLAPEWNWKKSPL